MTAETVLERGKGKTKESIRTVKANEEQSITRTVGSTNPLRRKNQNIWTPQKNVHHRIVAFWHFGLTVRLEFSLLCSTVLVSLFPPLLSSICIGKM